MVYFQTTTTNQYSDGKIAVSDMPGDEEFAYIWYIVFTIICFLTSFVLIYITVKVVKKVGQSDKIIPLMLINLSLSALCFAAFFIDQTLALRQEDDSSLLPNTCKTVFFTSLSTLFLAFAVLLNMNKWIYFTLRIQAQINIRQYEIAEMVAEE